MSFCQWLIFKRRRRVAIEDTIVQKGTVKFCDVVGLTNAKQALKEAIIMPLQFPHLFTGEKISLFFIVIGPLQLQSNLYITATLKTWGTGHVIQVAS